MTNHSKRKTPGDSARGNQRAAIFVKRCVLAGIIATSSVANADQRFDDRSAIQTAEVRLTRPVVARRSEVAMPGQRKVLTPPFVPNSPAPARLSDLVGDLSTPTFREQQRMVRHSPDSDFDVLWSEPILSPVAAAPVENSSVENSSAHWAAVEEPAASGMMLPEVLFQALPDGPPVESKQSSVFSEMTKREKTISPERTRDHQLVLPPKRLVRTMRPAQAWDGQPSNDFQNLKLVPPRDVRPPVILKIRQPLGGAAASIATNQPSIASPSIAPPSFAPPSFAPPSFAPPSFAPSSFAPPSFAPLAKPIQERAGLQMSPGRPTSAPEVTAAASRLRLMARSSMIQGKRLFDRGAVFSARESVITSLRQLVQSIDLLNVSNQSTASLTASLRAIEESKDFSQIYGIDDPGTLRRMAASHQTDALAGFDLDQIPSFAATSLYLQVAEDQFVNALATCDESGDALILLGRIEQSLAPEDTVYRGAVALAMHTAAARIQPDSAFIHRELGITMMNQGMDQPAAEALRKSISMRASRRGLRHLQQVSVRLGDQQTVQQCQFALQSPQLLTDSPIAQLQPAAFAATGPGVTFQRSSSTPTSALTSADNEMETKTASKWFPFFKR